MTPARLLVLAAGVALLVVTAASAATPPARWLQPVEVSTPGTDALVPVVAVDDRGNAMAVWAQSTNNHWTVMAAKRTAGRPWSPPRAISSNTQDAAAPQVAVDAAGNAVAVWQWFDGKNSIIQSAAYDTRRGGRGRPGQPLARADTIPSAPRLAVDALGNAVAVWTTLSLAGWTVEATVRSSDGSWEKATDVIAPAGRHGLTGCRDRSFRGHRRGLGCDDGDGLGRSGVLPAGRRLVELYRRLSQPDRTESNTPQVAIEADR